MTHWNHRVFSKHYGVAGEFIELTIREVYYNDDGTIFNYSGPIAIEGESIDELKQTLQWCLDCLSTPILEEEKVVVTDTDDDESYLTIDDEDDSDDESDFIEFGNTF